MAQQNSFKTPKGTELSLMDIKGKPYLTVQQRLIWFREVNPNFSLETEFVELGSDFAFAKAVVKDETGRILATGHKYEDVKGFQDFREKAESSAIGRALGFLGYGTQFALDLEEGERIVDAPASAPIKKYGPTTLIKNHAPVSDLANYTVNFGKVHIGKPLGSLTSDEILTLRDKSQHWLMTKGPNPEMTEFLDMSAKYLATIGPSAALSSSANGKGSQGPKPSSLTLPTDPPPFESEEPLPF